MPWYGYFTVVMSDEQQMLDPSVLEICMVELTRKSLQTRDTLQTTSGPSSAKNQGGESQGSSTTHLPEFGLSDMNTVNYQIHLVAF